MNAGQISLVWLRRGRRKSVETLEDRVLDVLDIAWWWLMSRFSSMLAIMPPHEISFLPGSGKCLTGQSQAQAGHLSHLSHLRLVFLRCAFFAWQLYNDRNKQMPLMFWGESPCKSLGQFIDFQPCHTDHRTTITWCRGSWLSWLVVPLLCQLSQLSSYFCS